jgi:Na+-translocating ferredoxin:NAD+ oxidoreductase subunit D
MEKENNKSLNLRISPSPHISKGFSTAKIMYIVAIALLFPSIAAVYFFGLYALILLLVSTAVCVLTEFVSKKLRKRPFIMDGSAVVTGILFALILPPRIPIWMAVLGAVFAIAIAKEAFGGLGFNIFNPALVGRAFLAVAFSGEMTLWYLPTNFSFDAVTGATPLNENFVFLDKADLYRDMFFGNTAGSIGETSALLIIIGAILLFALKIISWHIPVIYIATVALGMYLLGHDPLFHVLAGGLMIGAFFMATDYTTSPVSKKGKMIFALGAGLLTILFRAFAAMPEGVAFAILIMNALTPLIDRYTKIKPYGYVKPKKA